MDIEKIHPSWGLRINVQDAEQLFQQSSSFWKDTLYKNKLIVFKNINFSKDDYIQFAEMFGRGIVLHPFSNKSHPRLGQKAMPWHADLPNFNTKLIAFKGGPFPIRALWLRSNPNPLGGITGFLNISNSIDLLSSELKELIPRVTVTQQDWGDKEYIPDINMQAYDFVKIHPITQEKSLRLNHHNIKDKVKDGWICDVQIDGQSQLDCQLIQDYIDAILEHKEMIYYHQWNTNDLIIYDNWPLIHNRTALNISENEERLILRVNIDHVI
jgi:alpha-ketoglutarate-dependent taurine dioxygenase